mmetsp:Transcript_23017/g.41312  ORF Transcript_23017/g.41312 Transcript_23017/m.41312 type:complete len:89 (+) Transcript_23017:574-840(+)
MTIKSLAQLIKPTLHSPPLARPPLLPRRRNSENLSSSPKAGNHAMPCHPPPSFQHCVKSSALRHSPDLQELFFEGLLRKEGMSTKMIS